MTLTAQSPPSVVPDLRPFAADEHLCNVRLTAKFAQLLAASMIAMLTAGCAYVVGDAGIVNETPASVAQNVIIGKTNKAEVEAKYGVPSTVSFDSNGMEIWLYGSTAVEESPTAHKALEVHFDKDGSAAYYLLTEVDPQKRRQMQLAH